MAGEEEDYNPVTLERISPGQGYNERERIMEKPQRHIDNKPVVVVPRPKENALIADLDDNLEQTENFIVMFEKDKQTLGTTYGNCEDEIHGQFEKLREMLNAREDLQLQNLRKRYGDRDDLLEQQLSDLKKHRDNNEETKEEVINLVATMKDRDQRDERENQIRKLIDERINASPDLQKVPIDLKWSFETERETKKLLENYGRLHFRGIETGRREPFSRLNAKVVVNKKTQSKNSPRRVSVPEEKPNNNYDNNNNNNITLPELDKFFVKFDKKNNELLCEIKIKNMDDEKENLEHIFLHVNCHADRSKDAKNWDDCEIHHESHICLTKMTFNGTKYSIALEKEDVYQNDMIIHGRGRLVYLESDFDTENVLKSTDWSKENTTKFSGGNDNNNNNNNTNNNGNSNGNSNNIVNDNNNNNEASISTDSLPEKIKFRCKIVTPNDTKENKLISLTKSKHEMNYNGVLAKIQKLGKSSNNFNIIVKSTNANVTNDNELITHILSKAINAERNDLKNELEIEATEV